MRRVMALACVVGLLAALAAAAPAGARTTADHFTAVGPGVRASWSNGSVETYLYVFHQLNGGYRGGFFHEVLVVQDGLDADGAIEWTAMWDNFDNAPDIAISQPLRWASAKATVPFLGCYYGTCPADLPQVLDVSEEWAGTGPIERYNSSYDWAREPGVILMTQHEANFFRDATVADADPFGGALGDIGPVTMAGFFDVHVTQIFICHPGVSCE